MIVSKISEDSKMDRSLNWKLGNFYSISKSVICYVPGILCPPQHRIYNNSNTYYVLSFLVSNSLVLIIVRRKYKILCDLVNIGQTAWKRLDVWVFFLIVYCFLFETTFFV